MAIVLADNTPRIEYTVAQGVTQTVFPIPFVFFNKEDSSNVDVKVFVDGVERTLGSISTTTFSITSGGNGAKGSLSTTVTGASGGSTVIVLRDTKIGRTTDFPSGGAFEVSKLNTELDTLVAIEGDFEDHVSRSIRLQDKDTAVSLALPLKADRLGKQLGFNATTGAVQMFTPESLAIASDSGSSSVDLTSNTFTFTGGEGIDTSISNQTLTITGELASTSNKGVASFNSTNFTVSNGAVTAKDITLASDSGSATNTLGETFTLSGGTGLNTSATGNTVTMNVDAAQTGITSLLATDIKIGEDDQTKIDFETADQINFYANNVNVVQLSNANSGDAVFTVPTSDKDFVIKGNDGGSPITALTIDMSNSGDASFNNNVTVGGNLTVNGSSTTVNTATLTVEDPLISLASGNNSADSVDVGFYGLYDTSGSQDLYAGLFRDASDSGKFKLFKDLQVEPTTTVNTSGTGYAVGTLVANLEGTIQTAAQTNITSLGTLTGLTIDGDTTFTGANGNIVFDKSDDALEFSDSSQIKFGSDFDAFLRHTGSNLELISSTGDIVIADTTGDVRIQGKYGENSIVANNDGSVELYHDNVKKFETTSGGATVTGTLVSDVISIADGSSTQDRLTIGTNNDFFIYHDNQTVIANVNGSGPIKIQGKFGEQSIVANQDSSVELHFNGTKQFETTSTGASIRPDEDDVGLIVGKAYIGHVVHNTYAAFSHQALNDNQGAYALLQSASGQTLLNAATGQILQFRRNNVAIATFETDGSLNLKHGLTMNDNDKAIFGTGGDLEIYHDGSNSFISDVGTGDLVIQATHLRLRSAAAETYFLGTADGSVELYHNNVKKFETTATGAKISGGTGDAVLLLEADTTNTDENDNPRIEYSQDGGGVTASHGTDNSNKFFITATSSLGSTRFDMLGGDTTRLYHGTTVKLQTESNGVSISGSSGDTKLFIEADSDNDTEGDNAFIIFKLDGGVETSAVWTGNFGGSNDNALNLTNAGQFGGGIRFGTTATNNAWETATERMRIDRHGDITTFGTNGNIVFDYSEDTLNFDDNMFAKFGDSGDLRIFHSGTNSFIQEGGTGDLYIQSATVNITDTSSTPSGKFIDGGAVELYFNGTKKFETETNGVIVTGRLTTTSHIDVNNGNGFGRIEIGGSSGGFIDLKSPFTDDFDSRIITAGTNFRTLQIQSDDLHLKSRLGNANYLDATVNGAVNLYYNNSKVFETASTGVTIEDPSDSFASKSLRIIGKRSDANDSYAFSGKLMLATNRTTQLVDTGKTLGIIGFGGNHTDGTVGNILYGSAITGVSEGDFNSATDMPTGLAFFTGSTGRDPDTPNVTINTERMRIDKDGNVGIGTTTPSTKLEVAGDLTLTSSDGGGGNGPILDLYRNSPSPSNGDHVGTIQFNFENDADQKIQGARIYAEIDDNTDGTEDVAIFIDGLRNSSTYGYMEMAFGRVNILSDTLQLKNNASLSFEGATTDDFETFVVATDPTADRTITLPDLGGTVALTSQLSDIRDKKDVEDLQLGLDFVNAMRPVQFTWDRRDGSYNDVKELGFIAQELDQVERQFDTKERTKLVTEMSEDELHVSPMNSYPILVKAIQELSAQVESLQARVKELEG